MQILLSRAPTVERGSARRSPRQSHQVRGGVCARAPTVQPEPVVDDRVSRDTTPTLRTAEFHIDCAGSAYPK
jgi:hypothetical protein